MRTRVKGCLIFLLAGTILFGCKKDKDDPKAPVITYSSISKTQVTEFIDSLSIIFTYEDYQGDLGETDPDNYSLRIKDDRLSGYDWYHIPPMAPGSDELHIKGSYVVEIPPLFLLGNGTEESTRFTIQIRDRAGNWSNSIVTPEVLITD